MKSLILLLSAALPVDEQALQQCRSMADNDRRLACYDTLFAVSTTVTSVATKPESAAKPVPTTPVAIATQPAAVAAATPALRGQTSAEFGLEQKAVETQLDAIESRIVGEFRGWQAKSKITLENGQVWQISDGSRGVYKLDSPAVRIERGMLGVFFLKIEGANRSPKVKRLQ